MPSGIANRISWSVEIRQTSPLSPSHSAFSGRLPPFIIFYLMGRAGDGMAKHAAAAANPDPRHGGLPQCKHTMLCGDVLYVQDGPRGLDPEEIQFPGKFCTCSTYVCTCPTWIPQDPSSSLLCMHILC